MRLALALVLIGCGGKAVIDLEPAEFHGEGGAGGAATTGGGNMTTSGGGESCPRLLRQAQTATGWVQALDLLTESGGCSLSACHGEQSSAPNRIFLPASDPRSSFNLAFYRALINVTDGAGRRYVDPESPADSWMQCHIDTHGELDIIERGLIEDWIILGADHPEAN